MSVSAKQAVGRSWMTRRLRHPCRRMENLRRPTR